MRAYVIDSQRGELGLRMGIGADIACVRHRTIDDRCTGMWEVRASLPKPLAEVFALTGNDAYVIRPAVVDDFGSLVFVGEPQ